MSNSPLPLPPELAAAAAATAANTPAHAYSHAHDDALNIFDYQSQKKDTKYLEQAQCFFPHQYVQQTCVACFLPSTFCIGNRTLNSLFWAVQISQNTSLVLRSSSRN